MGLAQDSPAALSLHAATNTPDRLLPRITGPFTMETARATLHRGRRSPVCGAWDAERHFRLLWLRTRATNGLKGDSSGEIHSIPGACVPHAGPGSSQWLIGYLCVSLTREDDSR